MMHKGDIPAAEQVAILQCFQNNLAVADVPYFTSQLLSLYQTAQAGEASGDQS